MFHSLKISAFAMINCTPKVPVAGLFVKSSNVAAKWSDGSEAGGGRRPVKVPDRQAS